MFLQRCFNCDSLGCAYVVPAFNVFVCTECSGIQYVVHKPLLSTRHACHAHRGWPGAPSGGTGRQLLPPLLAPSPDSPPSGPVRSMKVGHRVKSISMGTFTAEEARALEAGGNAVSGTAMLVVQ